KDHNQIQFKKSFNRKQKAIRLQLRTLEEEFTYVLGPKITKLKVILNNLKEKNIVDNPEMQSMLIDNNVRVDKFLRETNESLLRLLEKLDTLNLTEIFKENNTQNIYNSIPPSSTQQEFIKSNLITIDTIDTKNNNKLKKNFETSLLSFGFLNIYFDTERIDDGIKNGIDEAVDNFRKKKKILVNKIYRGINELDVLSNNFGITF
ncbi:hypothetical protein HDU92_008020, partial [Lobulomyces angularis]